MQDTAVLNSPAEQVEHVERVSWIKDLRREAKSKSQAKVQEYPSDTESNCTQKAVVLMRLY